MTQSRAPIAFFSPPPRPAIEAWRQKRLNDLQVLDTAADPVLDDIVVQAAGLFNASTALVSLIDTDRQWFKARSGIVPHELPRALSFCGHAILAPDPFIILDAAHDPRFAANPLVTGGLKIAFYLGIPLMTADGYAIGTLCILDSQPRAVIDAGALAAVKLLAKRVIDRIEAQAAA